MENQKVSTLIIDSILNEPDKWSFSYNYAYYGLGIKIFYNEKPAKGESRKVDIINPEIKLTFEEQQLIHKSLETLRKEQEEKRLKRNEEEIKGLLNEEDKSDKSFVGVFVFMMLFIIILVLMASIPALNP